jgi:hypothetical protein
MSLNPIINVFDFILQEPVPTPTLPGIPWPDTIPQSPIYGGFTEQRQRNVTSFSPDVGSPKIRRRSTAVCVPCVAVFEFSDSQLDIFNTFYEDTLFDGTLPFTWRHPRMQTFYSWMFSVEEAPQIEATGSNLNRVSCKLIRLPGAGTSGGTGGGGIDAGKMTLEDGRLIQLEDGSFILLEN